MYSATITKIMDASTDDGVSTRVNNRTNDHCRFQMIGSGGANGTIVLQGSLLTNPDSDVDSTDWVDIETFTFDANGSQASSKMDAWIHLRLKLNHTSGSFDGYVSIFNN